MADENRVYLLTNVETSELVEWTEKKILREIKRNSVPKGNVLIVGMKEGLEELTDWRVICEVKAKEGE